MNRRTFLRGTLAAGTIGLAANAGLLAPRLLLADETRATAFESKSLDEALKAMGATPEESADISIDAPDVAANGATVRVKASTTLPDVSEISFLVETNPMPLASTFVLTQGVDPVAAVVLKFGKTSNVVVLVKSGDKVYSAKKEVKVTVGGCA
ncbi:thiosulfate oxidation carrier protein SoxY [Thiothrix nivea]|uniref:Thiosulfate-binding protein SoxY n=1 Tax=Thiothrix nivea (strain ATCC 35100 / DSM 5205 / JP2) TaxID=870187 RepID=A0A656HEM0_THINJ|nr:thiosulfate oxidation carrier protein SoxY [Thiothrix nivea]EIJ33860.1 thiosulfate-binding protein SoxY [Thiothrix nivea DSM 5205]